VGKRCGKGFEGEACQACAEQNIKLLYQHSIQTSYCSGPPRRSLRPAVSQLFPCRRVESSRSTAPTFLEPDVASRLNAPPSIQKIQEAMIHDPCVMLMQAQIRCLHRATLDDCFRDPYLRLLRSIALFTSIPPLPSSTHSTRKPTFRTPRDCQFRY
jgi:hypothetical protein